MMRRQALWVSVLFLAVAANIALAATASVTLSVEGMTCGT